MPAERVFLGWDSPCLALAAEWLIDHLGHDLSQITVALPGRRAGRRLTELLAQQLGRQPWVPPNITTHGQLPDLLCNPTTKPIANPIQSLWTWFTLLRDAPTQTLQPIAPSPPARDDLPAWLALATDLSRLADDIASAALRFADIPARCPALTDTAMQRWELLAHLQNQYNDRLTKIGVVDRNTARLQALEKNDLTSPPHLILIAATDLSPLTQSILRTHFDKPDPTPSIATLIHAPPALADAFDNLGGILPDAWRHRRIKLNDADILIEDDPRQQAQTVTKTIAATLDPPNHAPTSPDQITVGLADESQGPQITRALEWSGIPARPATGRPLTQTRPFQLLLAVRQYLQHRRPADLASLIRHPDLEAWLISQTNTQSTPTNWIELLDHFAADCLDNRIADWLTDPRIEETLKHAYETIESLLADLSDKRALSQWAEHLAAVLLNVYGRSPLDTFTNPDDDQLARALEMIGQSFRDQAQLDPDGPNTPVLTAPDAITLTATLLANQQIPPPAGPPAVELLGWLELQLDDAPTLIITGLNEGNIPSRPTPDPFLNDSTRRQLGLIDTQRRYARDAMILATIRASRPNLNIISTRHSHEHDPLAPSRLLLACDPDTLVHRIQRFYTPDPQINTHTQHQPPTTTTPFTIPIPAPRPPLKKLRVTAFKDYLACPYRFYLKHVVRLEALNDRATELDASRFGILTHDTLAAFGKDPDAQSDDPAEVYKHLRNHLDRIIDERFGKRPPAPVRAQTQALTLRLQGFAHWQAAQTRQGWTILSDHCEASLSTELDIDGQPFTITGRIDRIDQHPEQGHRVIDYKTFNETKQKSPENTHRKGPKNNKTWTDLQLPLYRNLVATIGITDNVQLGYTVLPNDPTQTDFLPALWDNDDLLSAFNAATEVIQNIRAGKFWPPASPPTHDDGLGPICMDEHFQRDQIIQTTQHNPKAPEPSTP